MILCGVRTIEVRRLTWGQFDIPSATWTVPADGEAKYKTGRATTIALSPAALAIIKKMQSGAQCQYVFNRKGKPLGQKAIIRELRACGVVETSHGFRSTVKVWGMKEAGYSAALMNKVLGHVHGDENETAADRAYAHSEAYLEERRPIMRAWAKYLGA
jgi:integrase